LMACIHGGIGVPQNWFIKQSFSAELKKRLTNIFTGPEVPDALVCEHDILAYNSIRIIHDIGLRVPQEVAVICFGDDMDVADQNDPAISTAHHPAFELGAVSAARLHDMIHEKKPTGNHVIVWPVSLRLRQSCGTPKHLRSNNGQDIAVPFSNFIGVCADVDDVSKRMN
jgi:DNA-binding LacI/PurR family transcriptional regulator